MKLEHLTNKSTTNLYDELCTTLNKVVEFSIGSAFINNKANNLIETTLKKNNRLKKGRLLIGLYNSFNKKEDLERLLELAYQYPDKLQIHISFGRNFHWKYYHFITVQKQIFYIGSANFTTSGMMDNREIVVKISGKKYNTEAALKNLSISFEKEWKNSASLGSFPLNYYKENNPEPSSKGQQHPDIEAFFKQKFELTHTAVNSDKAYAVLLHSNVKPSTVKAISNQKPEWGKNGWDWFVLSRKREFDQCCKTNSVFIFSKEGRNNIICKLVEIKEPCNDIETDDGKYLIAYKTIKRKKLLKDMLLNLKDKPFSINLSARKKQFYSKTLSKNQINRIKELLKL